mmetsp:Transcript_14131/g.30576  ORF Transcript_14131/g.30576 Transcript_14131/m.30576 type:complete len:115 (-) Transcript_14131:685-1029(-)
MIWMLEPRGTSNPRTCFSCERLMSMAAAEVKPLSTGSESREIMKSALSIAMTRWTTPTIADTKSTALVYATTSVGSTTRETESETSIEISANGPRAMCRDVVSTPKTSKGIREE